MQLIIEKLAALIDVKSLMSLAILVVFVTLALTGVLPEDKVMEVILIIVTFYFAKTQAPPAQ